MEWMYTKAYPMDSARNRWEAYRLMGNAYDGTADDIDAKFPEFERLGGYVVGIGDHIYTSEDSMMRVYHKAPVWVYCCGKYYQVEMDVFRDRNTGEEYVLDMGISTEQAKLMAMGIARWE